MELNLEHFKKLMQEEQVLYLATSKDDAVTLRPVSPLIMDDMTIYFYTSHDSEKYRQMKANPQVAFSVGPMGSYQAVGNVRFLGGIFADENAGLRAAYKQKYKGAFENPAPGEVMESNEFLAIDITHLKGWIFEGEQPVGRGEVSF